MGEYDVVAEIRADLKQYSAGMDEAIEQMKQFERGSSGSTSKVQKWTKQLGTVMMGAGAAITAMGVKSLTGFGNFQQSLNKAAVVAGGTAKDIDGLADVANRMGAELPLSAQDSADAMVQMAQDGASLADIKDEFPAIAKAATAAGADLQATAGTVQIAMNIWGDSIGSSAQAAAVLTETANVSNASVEEMQQAFADVGTMAAQLGFDMQDTATAIGMVTNSGLPAAQAAQDLNFALTRMIRPSKAAYEMAKSLGLSYYDAQGKMKSLPTLLSEIQKATAGLNDKQKQNALVTMYGTAGYKALTPLLKSMTNHSGKASQSWAAMSKSIRDASSSSKTAQKVLDNQASEMQQNVGSKIEQVGGNWESLSNKAAAAKGDVTGSLLDMTNGALEWAASSNDSAAQFTRSFVGLAPVIGPATTALGGFVRNVVPLGKALGTGAMGIVNFVRTGATMVQMAAGAGGAAQSLAALAKSSKVAAAAQWLLNSAWLASPITWIVAGIAAVVAALAIFFTKTEVGRQAWSTFVAWLGTTWQSLSAFAVATFQSLATFFTGLWQGIVDVGRSLWQAYGADVMAIWNSIVSGARGVFNLLKTVIMGPILLICDLVTGDFDQMGKDAKMIFDKLIGALKQIWEGYKGYLTGLLSLIVKLVVDGFNHVKDAAVEKVKSTVESVKSKFDALKNINLLKAGKAIMDSFLNGLTDTWKNVQKFVGGIGDWIRDHKGPISYDKRLLVDNGAAIMDSLNTGLIARFAYVKRNISSMADAIAVAATPSISMGDVAGAVNSANKQLQTGLSANLGGVSVDSSRTNQLLEKLVAKNSNVYLDRNKWVGATGDGYDGYIGEKMDNEGRWAIG